MKVSALSLLAGALLVYGGSAVVGAQTIEVVGFANNLQTGSVDPTVAPAGPTFLQATGVASTRVALLWQDNSNNETQYSVEVRLVGDPSFTVLAPLAANSTAAFVDVLTPGMQYEFRVRALNASGNSAYSNVATATTLGGDTPCATTTTAMCVHNSEFRVQAMFQTPPTVQTGDAHTVKLTADSGYLWFFDSENIEAVVKVLDGCGLNQRFWVFAGGLTNVRVLLIVTDTVANVSTGYLNPLNKAFQPIQDTKAFDTCF